MSKVFLVFLTIVLITVLGYGGWVLFQRYGNTASQVERTMRVMSELQTARVSLVLKRTPRSEDQSFLFGDLRMKGVLDLRAPSSSSYDLRFDAATVANASEERTVVLARRVNGKTFLQLSDVPRALSNFLASQGVPMGSWEAVDGTGALVGLLGERGLWPVFTPALEVELRRIVAEGSWFTSPKATLTEIVHGRVTRIYTTELNVDAVLESERAWIRAREGRELTEDEEARMESHPARWEGARVNLWIDQRTDELRRAVIQLVNGDTLDIEFEELNEEVVIEAPEDGGLPMSENGDVGDRGNEAGNTEAGNASVEGSELFPSVGDTDGDGLTDDLEGFYGSDLRNPDTDGDGYLDGEEVKNGYSPRGDGTLFNFGLPTL